jgi:hypothetical protein
MKYERETRIRLHSIANHTRISKVYTKKAVKYGDSIEVFEYEKPQISFTREGEVPSARRTKGTRTESSISRARRTLFRLVEGNVRKHGNFPPVFVTLTYKDNIQDLRKSNYLYKKFVKRLNYFLGTRLKYVTVPEWQSRGAIHYHTVFFNLPYIDKFTLEDIWSHGFTNIQVVKNIRSMGAYLAKYFSKSANDPRLFGERSYFASRGLNRPVDIYGGYEVDDLMEHVTIVSERITPYKEYKHKKYATKPN